MDSSTLTLPPPYGRFIDRQQPVAFHFDNRSLLGYAGDTIASALARCGVRVISRSFKYHRPRGILSLNGLDANLLVSVDGEANVDAGTTPLRAGMRIEAQNYAGSLTYDLKSVFGLLGRWLPAGFYYRHFYRPRNVWPRLWEPFFRKQAGLGTIDLHERRRHFRNSHAFYDVVVVGGGSSGMMAALEAARRHPRVLLIDRNPRLGGRLNYSTSTRDELQTQIANQPNIDVWTCALCNGWYAEHWLAVIRDDTLIRVRAGETVFAVGSHERLPLFRNNDLPGVMFGGTAQRLIELYAVKPGRRAVVVADDDRGYEVATTLRNAGVEVAAILDARRESAERSQSPHSYVVPVHHARVVAALPAAGKRGIRGVRFEAGSGVTSMDCDLLVIASGHDPADQLYRQAAHTFGSRTDNPPSCTGSLVEAMTAATSAGTGGSAEIEEAFIDLDEDITVADLRTAVAAGYQETELAKRFTTVGMGPSQGRHSARAAAGWLAVHSSGGEHSSNVTTARPPLFPEKVGILAGAHLCMDKQSPLHRRTLAAGAHMMLAGGWLRPEYYERGQGRAAAVEFEITSVRNRVGLLDVSPLGKIEVRGRDAGEFLDRLYTMSYATLAAGKTRYLLMTNDAGFIIDDGVTYRVDEDLFYVTATSSSVERTFRSMLRWRAIWKLDVAIVNVTNAYAALNLAGPRSRDVLQRLSGSIDLSATAFPYLGGRSGVLEGIPVRMMRIGFVGELGYEIHFPAEHAEHLWDALMQSGTREQLQPVGLQALRALRLEKAHIIVGQDTDPLTWPDEVGMQWALSRKKPFFVGKPSIDIMRGRPLTRRLVGFVLPADGPLPQESELIVDGGTAIGYITSIARSSTCSSIVGLGFVEGSDFAAGRELQIVTDGRIVRAKLVDGAFYDPEAKRQEG